MSDWKIRITKILLVSLLGIVISAFLSERVALYRLSSILAEAEQDIVRLKSLVRSELRLLSAPMDSVEQRLGALAAEHTTDEVVVSPENLAALRAGVYGNSSLQSLLLLNRSGEVYSLSGSDLTAERISPELSASINQFLSLRESTPDQRDYVLSGELEQQVGGNLLANSTVLLARVIAGASPKTFSVLVSEVNIDSIVNAVDGWIAMDNLELFINLSRSPDAEQYQPFQSVIPTDLYSLNLTDGSISQYVYRLSLRPDLIRNMRLTCLLYGLLASVLMVTVGVSLMVYLWRRRDQENQLAKEIQRMQSIQDAADKKRFELFFNVVSKGLVVVDRDNRIQRANRKLLEIFDFGDELIGEHIDRILHFEGTQFFSESFLDQIETSAADGSNGLQCSKGLKKDGGVVDVEVSFVVVEADGERYGVGTVEDISGRMLYQAQVEDIQNQRIAALDQARANAEKLAKHRGEFLSSISHEIRTPMHAIWGQVNMIMEREQSRENLDLIKKVRLSCQKLMVIINNALDIEKIESGGIEVEIQSFQMNDLTQSISSMFSSEVEAKGNRLQVDVTDNFKVYGDFNRLKQVLCSLLDNAIKYTSNGIIYLNVEEVSRQESWVTLHFSVKDTGSGMALNDGDGSVESFTGVDDESLNKFQGTGVGLTIAARLVRLMGGQLELVSHPGLGTNFSFEITMKISTETSAHSLISMNGQGADELAGKRILVVDDNSFNLEVAEHFLTRHGAVVECFDSGVSVVDFLNTDSSIADLVLMDIEMPMMDGCESCRAIKAMPDKKHIPVVALSANVTNQKRDQAFDSGMCDFILKPFEEGNLIYTLTKILDAAESDPGSPVDGVATDNGAGNAGHKASDLQKYESLVDFEKGCETWGSEHMFLKFLAKFRDRHKQSESDVVDLIKAGNYTSLGKLAHKMKGAAASVQLTSLAECLRDMECAVKENRYQDVPSLGDELVIIIRRTLSALDALEVSHEETKVSVSR